MKQHFLEKQTSPSLRFFFFAFTSFNSTLEENSNTTAREVEEGTHTQKEEEEKSTTQEGKTTENSITAMNGRSGKTTPPNSSLKFDFAQTLFISVPKGTTASQTPERQHHPEGRGESSTTHQKNHKTSNTEKEEGERNTTQKERRDCNTTQERKTTPHQTRTETRHQPKQHCQKGKRRGKPHHTKKRRDPQLYTCLLQHCVIVTWFDFVQYSYII